MSAIKDAVEVASHAYKVVEENERVRVLEVRMQPGDKTEMHSHPALVAIAISDGQFKFTLSDGQTIEAGLKAGQTLYQDAVEHTTENIGSNEVRAILVELK